MNATTASPYRLWLSGGWAAATDDQAFERQSPYDPSTVTLFANATAADAERAIEGARRAFDAGPWPRTTTRTRHDVLLGAASLLRERTEDFAERMVVESGKPITLARGEVAQSARTLEYYAGLALTMEDSAIASRNPHALGLIIREPVGVAALITAWNFPLLGIVCKLAPALAAGCTVVAKPSHLCPGPGVLLAEALADAGLPPDVFNLVTSDLDRGAVVGQALAASPLIDKIAFTGSTSSGTAVMRAAAANAKRVSLELGGKSANIIFADADLDLAARTAVSAFTFNSGQQCSAGSRLLIQREIHDEVVERLVKHVEAQVLGNPARDSTTMGPLISQQQRDRVLNYIELGRHDATLAAGGGAPAGQRADSLFVEPTIFDRVDNRSRIAQEEVFGPVLSIISFGDEADAISLANDSRYGLAGGVWTRDISRAIRVVKAVRTGKMFVNAYNTAGIDDMPHGGVKDSGAGREFGLAGLDEFLDSKTVQILL